MPCEPPSACHEPGDCGPCEERSALLAHAALFDHIAPIGGARVLVHGTAAPTGFHAVQLAKAAGAWTVAAAVTGPDEACAARRAGADLVIDTAADDPVWTLRRHTGREYPIDRIVHGRFGHEPGIDLAVLARGGVIAVHGLAGAAVCANWWHDLLSGGVTVKLVALEALTEAVLQRARADVRSLRATGRWRDATPRR